MIPPSSSETFAKEASSIDAWLLWMRDADWSQIQIFGSDNDGAKVDTPSVLPDVRGMSNEEAAAAYAAAGFDILPVRPGTKNPGSYVGGNWPDKATHDPDTIRGWWAKWPDAGMALHPGKCGLYVEDIDKPELVPAERWKLLDNAVFRPSTNDPNHRRGHYFFRLRPGDAFANPVFPWGEGRCVGGAIILAPSVHPCADEGRGYHSGPEAEIPFLPNDIAETLTSASMYKNSATRRRLPFGEAVSKAKAFLDEYMAEKEPWALAPVLANFDPASPDGRHPRMWKTLCWAMREGKAGRFAAKRAVDELRELWVNAIGAPYRDGDPDEFDRMLRDAVDIADEDTVQELWERAHRLVIDEEEFWASRPILRDLRQFARARRVGPWAMLGCVLTLATAAIPPNVVLPPLVGSEAGLNLFVAVVGKSGTTKSAAMNAAQAWLQVEPEPAIKKPGSGEGLAKCFAYKGRDPNSESKGLVQIGKAWSVLAIIPEVDTLAVASGRGSGSILSALREGWSGERLGGDYAGDDKTVSILAHRYRLGLIVGVQPLRAGALMDDADGGTPQRFVWMPARDTQRVEIRPDEPGRVVLGAWPTVDGKTPMIDPNVGRTALLGQPADPARFEVLRLPEEAIAEIDAAARARSGPEDPDTNPLDGHLLLCQEKVAAGLMWLDGRTTAITSEDWRLAGQIIAVSNQTRAGVLAEIGADADRRHASAGRAAGVRRLSETQVLDTEEAERIARIGGSVVKKLAEADGKSLSLSELKRKLAAKDRKLVHPDVIEHLLIEGRITYEEVEYQGQKGLRIALVDGAAS